MTTQDFNIGDHFLRDVGPTPATKKAIGILIDLQEEWSEFNSIEKLIINWWFEGRDQGQFPYSKYMVKKFIEAGNWQHTPAKKCS